jgi:hypothetical protein
MNRPIGISVPHRRVEDDDDIQDYKKPWVGLTDEEINEEESKEELGYGFIQGAKWAEAKLKEKNG